MMIQSVYDQNENMKNRKDKTDDNVKGQNKGVSAWKQHLGMGKEKPS